MVNAFIPLPQKPCNFSISPNNCRMIFKFFYNKKNKKYTVNRLIRIGDNGYKYNISFRFNKNLLLTFLNQVVYRQFNNNPSLTQPKIFNPFNKNKK